MLEHSDKNAINLATDKYPLHT